MKKAKGKSIKVKGLRAFSAIFLCPLIAFTIFLLAADSPAQTKEQLKFYADRLEFGEMEVKRDALFALRNFESEAASRLALPALQDPSEIIRATATHTIIFLPNEEATQNLLPLLTDEDEFVRRETVYALGKVGNPNTAPKLIKILQQDKELEVRTAAAVALGQIGNIRSTDALTKILQKKSKRKEEFLRRAVARSIGQIAENVQTQIFRRKPPNYKSATNLKYQNLSEYFPVFNKTVRVLIKNLQNKKEIQDVKRETAFALGAIGDKSAIPVLQSNLNNSDYYLVEICQEALKKLSN